MWQTSRGGVWLKIFKLALIFARPVNILYTIH
jgi:hypothetical protein